MKLISRQEARDSGLKLFFTGRECKNGHTDQRRVSNSNCLLCEKMQNKRYYDLDPELHRARAEKWRMENPEKYSARREVDRLKRKEAAALRPKRVKVCPKEKERKRYKRDREKRLKQCKVYYKKNKKRIQEYKRKWHKENPEKAKASRWRRKAREKAATGEFSSDDLNRIFNSQKGKCIECKKGISGGYDVDHIMPLFLGGSNHPENIQLLCSKCNRRKSYKHPIEWANENGRLL